jgi:beta-xylosidase
MLNVALLKVPEMKHIIQTIRVSKKVARTTSYLVSVGGVVLLVALLGFPISFVNSVIHPVALSTPVPTANAYGFSTALDTLSDTELDQRLSDMKATGADWVRFDISWDKVQPNGPGSYDWSKYDRIQRALSAHKMHALGIIDFTPAWARSSSCTDSKMCPPRDVAAFARFAATAAKRYCGSGMKDWEIWNEPNISFRYHPAADPAGYTNLLKASYLAIKQADPTAVVIAGGTAPSETNSTNLTPADFIKALYANGAKGYFDAIAAHPYTYPNSPADNLPLAAWDQMQTMHDIMSSHGDGGKKIWVTEFGAPTNGPNKSGEFVSEQQQAQILTDALRIYRSYSWAGPFFWYNYVDTGTSTLTSENFYGLVRNDNSHKPAYDSWVNGI